jgi:hypothetical protein
VHCTGMASRRRRRACRARQHRRPASSPSTAIATAKHH